MLSNLCVFFCVRVCTFLLSPSLECWDLQVHTLLMFRLFYEVCWQTGKLAEYVAQTLLMPKPHLILWEWLGKIARSLKWILTFYMSLFSLFVTKCTENLLILHWKSVNFAALALGVCLCANDFFKASRKKRCECLQLGTQHLRSIIS